MIFRLGITGGIGSGKSTVCKVFNVLGIPVFSADDEGRVILDNDPDVRKKINSLVAEDLYISGELDRTKLASIIFNNKDMLNRVNAIVHPPVLEKYENWCKEQDSDYVIFEAAIIFEAGVTNRVDKILAVIAPLEERIQRVMSRNSMSREQVIERVNNQISDNEMLGNSDYYVNNSDNDMIIPRIIDIHNIILSKINK